MARKVLRPRILLVAPAASRATLCGLIGGPDWDVVEVSSLEQAAFVQDGQPCQVVVLEGSVVQAKAGEGLAWLAEQVAAPLVLLSAVQADLVTEGLRHGTLWMPLEIAREHPLLLRALLTQAMDLGQERQLCRHAALQLRHCNARVDRLLGLLWEAVPGEGPTRWYSQRYMLERLDEEVSRSRRHQSPLSVILGEMQPTEGEPLDPEQIRQLGDWVARKISESKRRCDVAGQYGLGGFMLLLPHSTAEQAAGACRRLRHLLEHQPHEIVAPLHVRFGTASVPSDEASVQTLLRRAEERLESASETETPS